MYDDRYIKTKTKTYGDKVYNSFRGLNVPKDRTECESVTVIFINSLLAYANKHYLQVTLDKMIFFLGDNVFGTDEDYLL